MKVSLTLNVPSLKTTKSGQEYCATLAQHIVDTFDDDMRIESIEYSVPKQKE